MTAPTVQFHNGTIVGAASVNLPLTGSYVIGDTIYIAIGVHNGSPTVTSATCTNASVSNRPTSVPAQTAMNIQAGVFTSSGSDPTVTVNFSGSANSCIAAMVISGAPTSGQIFDPGGSAFPVLSSSATATYTTTNADDVLIFVGFDNAGNTKTVPAGWTQLENRVLFGNVTILLAVLTPGIVESGLSAAMTGSSTNPFNVADAILPLSASLHPGSPKMGPGMPGLGELPRRSLYALGAITLGDKLLRDNPLLTRRGLLLPRRRRVLY